MGLKTFFFLVTDVFRTQHARGRLGCKTHLKARLLALF